MYLSTKSKFVIAFVPSLTWTGLSIWLAQSWIADLGERIGEYQAVILISLIAIIPGFMNAFMITSLLLDRRPNRRRLDAYPSLSILVAAYNEAAHIEQTIVSIDRQAYPGLLEVIVIDDGSVDGTGDIVSGMCITRSWLRLVRQERNGGKARALNRGLEMARHELVITLDADSYLFREALQHIVERYVADPADTVAVAGTIMVRNSRVNWVTKAQEWDYFHGIATVKRVQSLYQGTLVAQGAFSLYSRRALLQVGGWPETVGEDIVLTWALLEHGGRVGYCEDGIVFTTVPTTMHSFVRQRQRWARGMIEAFKFHPLIIFKPRLSTFFIWWNLCFPLLDLAYVLAFIPGMVLACMGCYWIAGPMTLFLLPIGLLINTAMFTKGAEMFRAQGLQVRRNYAGFTLYMLAYASFSQTAAVLGYAAEILNLRKTWGTK